MRGDLLDPDTGAVMASGEVTLSQDGYTGVIELDTPPRAEFDLLSGRAVIRLSTGRQLDVAIADTVPPRHAVRFPTTIPFLVRRVM